MQFDISVQGTGQNKAYDRRISLEALGWFDAFVDGLRSLELRVHAKGMSVSLFEDGVSARVDLPDDSLNVFVMAPDATTQTGTLDVFRLPMRHPDAELATLSPSRKYAPGDTVKFLTTAFMRLADLYGTYGDDSGEALGYVLQFADRMFECEGGAVFVRDAGDPLKPISGAVAFGPAELTRPIVWGRGVVGQCAEQGEVVNSPQARQGFFGEPMAQVGAAMCVPIHQNDELMGVIALYELPGTAAFSESQVGILSQISRTVGEYLRHVHGS